MTRYERIAAKAVVVWLADKTEPVVLHTVSLIADEATRGAGKKRDLYGSLYPYADILPADWKTQWLSAEGCSDSMLYAVPGGWTPGTPAHSLLMGNGALRPA